MFKNKKKNKKNNFPQEKRFKNLLPESSKKYISGLVFVLVAIIVLFSFFDRSGPVGIKIKSVLYFLIGNSIFFLPLFLFIAALVFFSSKYRNLIYPLILATSIVVLGISGILESLNPKQKQGGILGYFTASYLLKWFDFLITQIIFLTIILIGLVIFWHLLGLSRFFKRKQIEDFDKAVSSKIEVSEDVPPRESLVKKVLNKVIVNPGFKVKEISSDTGKFKEDKDETVIKKQEKNLEAELKNKSNFSKLLTYKQPPLDLLEKASGKSSPGDIQTCAAIIKKTLQNFEIPVEMAEVNIGPTVTQYTLKPAEGIKLSKITALNNDLALALAAHPIRIEAPIPGKSLVGIEVPNKTRAKVRLRQLIENSFFQSSSPLTFALGQDVAGYPVFGDLARMPHLLVAGSTGSGKTIFLSNLILSLLYKNSPQLLRFILIDPKRVEFVTYNDLPHLLSPVIFDAVEAINALKWLIGEMERRFDVLSEARNRDIASFNASLSDSKEIMPYIVLIIDEMADLMAARPREMELGVVRLAQMARAVGIHLVLATQRPSVEVITGLIKANITSRVAFQVASQVDSRTILDTAGAEKLLGAGDFLYLSSDFGKPRRIQSAFVSEKEVKKVVSWIKQENAKYFKENGENQAFENHLAQDLQEKISFPNLSIDEKLDVFDSGEDPLYEEAKKEVILAKKASVSFLQRRLRIGYARAARLIDMLEERGVVGPGEGAKPRQVYLNNEDNQDKEWQKL